MSCYQITMNVALEMRYQKIAAQLGMTVEQVLCAVAQIYGDCMIVSTTVSDEEAERVREYEDRCMGI